MNSRHAIDLMPEITRLCVSVETVHKPDLADLNEYLTRRKFVPCEDLRREIAVASKDPDRCYQALSRQVNCISFASSDDFQRWLPRLLAALEIIQQRLGV